MEYCMISSDYGDVYFGTRKQCEKYLKKLRLEYPNIYFQITIVSDPANYLRAVRRGEIGGYLVKLPKIWVK